MKTNQMSGLALLVAASFGAPAFAAERDCHIGVLGGTAVAQARQIEAGTRFDITGSFDVRGGALGAGAGCTWRLTGGTWRYGFEADVSATNANGRVEELPPNTGFTAETKLRAVSTLRAIAGAEVAPRWLLYGTAGIATAPARVTVCSPSASCASESRSLGGFAGGVGMEYAMTQAMRLKLEYLYIGFEQARYTLAGFLDRELDLGLHLLRAGVNLHF